METNRFYPLPSELKMDDFLIKLFTPRSGIKELCDYLTELIKDISLLYREESEHAFQRKRHRLRTLESREDSQQRGLPAADRTTEAERFLWSQ